MRALSRLGFGLLLPLCAATAQTQTTTTPAVDSFGQTTATAWPGKAASEAELRADVDADAAYYEALRPPVLDRFGGAPGSGPRLGLAATGFFHVEEKAGKTWLVDPDGNAFFHLGVCGVGIGDTYTVTKGREAQFAWLPPANDGQFQTAWRQGSPGVFSFYVANEVRKYGLPHDPGLFETRMIGRLRKWGFNSIGAFSPLPPAVQEQAMPYVAHLPLDPYTAGIPALPGIPGAWDPFEPANREKVDKSFAKSVAARADDPLLVGWFLANEPLYEDVPKVVPKLKGDHACKRELVAFLKEKYGDVAAFDKAWALSAASFDALADAPLAATTREAFADLHAFAGRFHEAYYKLVAETFRKYDAHHLLLGSRFQPGTINDEQLCRIAGKYVDVMSFNYYTDALDAELLKRIHDWCGRPLLLSEFYWASDADSGLSGGRAVAAQRERGLAYRNYVEQAAALGFVVGIEWFQLIDEAASGRWFEGVGGERANCGLLSVADRPYKEALAPIMETNYGIYGVLLDGKKPFAFDDPRFAAAAAPGATKTATAPRATGPVRVDGTTKNWPGTPPEILPSSRLVQGTANGAPLPSATFKVCWNDTNLYLLVEVTDATPLRNVHAKNPGALWMGDALEIFLGTEEPGAGGPLRFGDRHLLVGAASPGAAPVFFPGGPVQGTVETVLVPTGQGYTAEAAIPWTVLGLNRPPQPGAALLFDLGLDDSADGKVRRVQLMWNGTDKNSGDRTHWGRLKLLP